jgi:hypothetical protein
MTLVLKEAPMPQDLVEALNKAFKRHLKGRRPTYETVAVAAFFVGYLFQLTESDDLMPEELGALVEENFSLGMQAAMGAMSAASGRRQ